MATQQQPLNQQDPVATHPMKQAKEVRSVAENEAVDESHTLWRFRWTIEKFSQQTNKMLYSDTFVVDGYKWRVLIFPKGNYVDYLSMYLEVADYSALPNGWSRHAQFSLAVVNQMNDKLTIKKDTQHEFNARDNDWGFTSFMPVTDLYDASQGFLMNDTCIIQADVTLRKTEVKGKRKRNDPPAKKQLLYDDGEKELLNLKTEKGDLVKNVPSKSDWPKPLVPEKVSSPLSNIIRVQGYKVKNNIAPILEAILKKYGDIASDCVFKPASTRSSLLESVCEVVMRIGKSGLTTTVAEMEEIECQMSALEGAKVDVSWLRAHLEAIQKRKEAKKNSYVLMETKTKTVLVKRAAQMDLIERRAALMDAQEWVQKAEKCVSVLDLVDKKLGNNILEAKAKKDSWVKRVL